MDFSDVMRMRRMVRDFDTRPIPQAIVQRILIHAQRGPSSGFTQGFEFLVFDGVEQTKRFWAATPWWNESSWDGARNAPLLIVPVAHEAAYVARYRSPENAARTRNTGADFPAPYWFIDTAFAAMLVLLSAVDAGLGAYYFSIGPTSREIPEFCKSFGIPDAFYPIGAIAIGYPAESDQTGVSDAIRQRRRSSDSLFHRGRW
ncbi:MAG: nitroreductase family protein [Aggregatilineales bacterium]